ncbi:MAG: acetylxylan esterase, partial [Pirellulales bacterium]|nr:acetylxylan esterase [Pirellulales bacterium]
SSLGRFPLENRPAVRAEVTGRLDHGDHVVEKLVYESLPGLYVTALAYVPKKLSGRAPAVLCLNGHWPQSKATPDIQRRCAGLARMGVIAFCQDVVGAGERAPASGDPPLWYHGGYRGAAPWIVDRSLLGYILYECMRAVDYVAARPDVDPARIFCTGASGGGKQSLFLAALDDRLAGAVPVCYVSNYQVHMGATACVGEVPFGVLRYTDQWEILAMHAPRPALCIAASRDSEVFQPKHMADAVDKASRIYALYGRPSLVRGEVVDSGHAYNRPMRELLYNHLARHLLGAAEPRIVEPDDLPVESEESLRCGLSPESESLGSLTFRRAREMVEAIPAPADAAGWCAQKQAMRARLQGEILGARPDRTLFRPSRVRTLDFHGHRVEHWILETEPGLPLPAVLAVPKSAQPGRKQSAVVLADERGKQFAMERGLFERLLDAGCVVLAIDLRGLGETAGTVPSYPGAHDYNLANYSLFCGRPMFGMWAYDLDGAADWLAGREEVDASRIVCAGRGIVALSAALAAAGNERIRAVVAEEMLDTWVFPEHFREIGLSYFVPKILTVGDTDHLAACVAPRPLVLLNPVDGQRRPVDPGAAARTSFAERVFSILGKPGNFVRTRTEPDRVADYVLQAVRSAGG